VRRLRRDAALLGLEAPDEEALLASIVALGREAFAEGAGIVRLALRPPANDARCAMLVGTTRALGPERRLWDVIRSALPHPGPSGFPGIKREGVAVYDAARDAAKHAGVDDVLLADARGRVVEGARSNVFVVRRDGALVTPPLAHGAVAGVAREIVLERVQEAREEAVPLAILADAREIVLVNAVRGAVRILTLDGGPVGRWDEASWTERLHALLVADPPPPDR
jgi:branched-subunit amino acid aminotransferase/4-amino-4-deoxychorismate lyase